MFFNTQLPKTLIALLCWGLFFGQDGTAQGFEVEKAQVDITISEKGYFDVVEKYDLVFTQRKHGIYRNIQTKYNLITAEGKKETRRIKIRRVEVPGHKYTSDPDFVQKLSDNYEIKIGDKNTTIIGPQHYEIRYRVYNAFLFEDSQIQFYWNIKPDGWKANFKSVDFTITPPYDPALGIEDFFVYSGASGDSDESGDFVLQYNYGVFTAQSKPGFTSGYGQSVTALLNLPSGTVAEIKPFWPFWTHYGWGLILAAILATFYWIWNRYGKDDRVVTAISYFPPSGVDPAMAGFLIDDRADTPDLISLIPCWGARGIIRMEQIPKSGFFGKEDTKLVRLRPLPADSPDYEVEIFTGLFGSDNTDEEKEVLISSLKNSFYTTMKSAKEKLQSKAQIYYDPKARKVKTQTTIGLILLNLALFVVFLFSWGLIAALALIPVTIFLLVMTHYLVKKNSKGNATLSELQGFKQFIKIAEEKKLKMLIKDSPNYFETTMAYALAFGLFDRWAKKFEVLDVQPPSWYSSTAGVMSMNSFSNSFARSMSSAQSTMVSAPSSSSGGGSAGGGFGGGGGGSW